MSDTLSLVEELVRRPSVTPDDAGCMDLVIDRLAPLGFACERLDFGDTRNVWLRRGSQPPLFAFAGHTDVVPAGPTEAWHTPPFQPTRKDGLLYGRGAADMKASIAAMVTACERFLARQPHPPGSIAFLLTSDEEGPATDGTVKVIETLEARGEKITWCLVGEPSSQARLGDVIRIGRRGSLSGTLRIFGTQGHVAYPELVDNPIHRFAPALKELSEEVWDRGNASFPPTSLQISNINGGTGAENVVPGHLDVLFNLRYSTELDETAIKQRVHGILDRHPLKYRLDWRLSGAPFLTTGNELLAAAQAALTEICGAPARADTGGGTSDGRFIAPTGAQVIELGPLNASIHKVNECVSVADIETLSEIYQNLLSRLLARE